MLYEGCGNRIHGRIVNYSAAVITTTHHLLNHFTYTERHSHSLMLWTCYSFIPFCTLFLLRLLFLSTEQRTEQNRTEQNRTEQNRTEQNRTGHLLNQETPSCLLCILCMKWMQLNKDIFLFSKAPRPALGPIQPPIQGVPWVLSAGEGYSSRAHSRPLPLSAAPEFKNAWSCTSTPLSVSAAYTGPSAVHYLPHSWKVSSNNKQGVQDKHIRITKTIKFTTMQR
jgi:hypothetical protein